MAECHIEGCGRDAAPGVPVCEVCRLSYLNGYNDAVTEHNQREGRGRWPTPDLCHACGHLVHEGASSCAWHGGSCEDARRDPDLWCQCDGKHPLGRQKAMILSKLLPSFGRLESSTEVKPP